MRVVGYLGGRSAWLMIYMAVAVELAQHQTTDVIVAVDLSGDYTVCSGVIKFRLDCDVVGDL